jgi:hypothetical protein
MKRLRGKLSQGEFAKAVGIPRPKVYEYEAGTKRPAFKPFVLLGFYALDQRREAEANWFFSQSGIDMDSLIELSELLQKNARDTLSSGIQITNVLPHPKVPSEGKQAEPLPAWMISSGRATFYVEATDDFIVPFSRGDLILVDSSEVNQAELLGSYVVAHRPNHFSDAERLKLQDGFVGSASPEEIRRRRDRSQFPFLRTGLFVGRLVLDPNPTFGVSGGLRGIEIRTKAGDTLFEVLRPDAHELIVPETDADRKAIDRMARKAVSSSLGAANRKNKKSVLHLYTDLQILGRAIGWISSPATRTPSKKEPKKK